MAYNAVCILEEGVDLFEFVIFLDHRLRIPLFQTNAEVRCNVSHRARRSVFPVVLVLMRGSDEQHPSERWPVIVAYESCLQIHLNLTNRETIPVSSAPLHTLPRIAKMHCTSQSLLRSAFSTVLRQSAITPPSFLLPFALQQFTPFSTTAVLEKKRYSRRDANPARGTSALRRTGLKKQRLSVSHEPIPQPRLEGRSAVEVDENHGLWGFFTKDKEVLEPPTTIVAHGRAWTVPELRMRDWDDLHRLWWVCVKEVNRINTMEAERVRVKAGYGEYEAQERRDTVRNCTQPGHTHRDANCGIICRSRRRCSASGLC